MKSLSIAKRLAFAAVAAGTLAGPVTSAQALTITTGDLLLEVYGNGTEYTKDLGNMATVLSTGVDLDLTSILGSVGGVNTIKYTVVATTGSTITDSVLFGDQSPRAPWTSLQLTTLNPANIQNGIFNWETTKLNGVPGTDSALLAKTDAASFSTNLDPAGSGSLGGSVPTARPAFSVIDSTLNLLGIQVNQPHSTLSDQGTALLSSQTGHFVIPAAAAPVPVPAAVVLFATGVIGLIGVARRKVFGQQ